MTEAEWLACTDPQRMLHGVGERVGRRKLILFACACARRAWGLVTVGREDGRLECLESMAERWGTPQEHGAASHQIVDIGLTLARVASRLTGTDHAARYNTAPRFLTAVSDVAVMARIAAAAGKV